MSKRDKPNRFSDKPHFEELPSSNEADKTASLESSKSKPAVYDPDEDERTSYFNFSGIGAFLGGCREKLTAFSKPAVAKMWGCCRLVVRWTWIGLRKIPSYCVLRWDSEDETESPDVGTKKPKPVAIEGKDATPRNDSKGKSTPEKVDFDEDELASSRWWSIGIKAASVAVALLILGGGYFAIKPLLFNTPTNVAQTEGENLVPTEQPLPLLQPEESASVAETAVPERKPAIPEPAREKSVNVAPAPPPQPPVIASVPNPGSELPSQEPFPSKKASPLKGSSLDTDPFAQAATPAVAESAPPIANDPFGTTTVTAVPSASPASHSSKNKNLAALQPLAPLDSAPQPRPQLQPLGALDSSVSPSAAVAAAPAPTTASANAPVASNYNSRSTTGGKRQAQHHNPAFGEAPTPPTVNAMPRTTVQQTMAVVEPIREIVPQIPSSGTVQAVSPPPAPPTPVVAEVSSARSVYANESAPAIPKDAPAAATPVSVVAVPAHATPAAPSTPQIVPADSQLMDGQLWEQLRTLREETDSEPSHLQLNGTTAAAEPALRFTPKQTAPPTNAENTRLQEAADQFRALLPVDELDPSASEIESRLPALERAPQPVFAEALPAYRNNHGDGERGMTFQNRIDSEIKRTPSATERYTVQQGDTYMTISDKFYGTSLLYSALAEHNRNLGIGWKPAEGVVIEIPTAEYLRTYYHQQHRAELQRPAIRYIVQEGDTIFRLATDKLQDTNRWREIYAMNSDRIQDVRDLKPGMEILLPVESARTNRQQTH